MSHQIFYRQQFPFQWLWPVFLCNTSQDCFPFLFFRFTMFFRVTWPFVSFALTTLQFHHSFSASLCVLMSVLPFLFSSSQFHLFGLSLTDFRSFAERRSFFDSLLSVILFWVLRTLFYQSAFFMFLLLPILSRILRTQFFHLFFCQWNRKAPSMRLNQLAYLPF